MNTLKQQQDKIRQQGRLGLMTHTVVGYPTLEASKELILEMAAVGVDFVELQIPFTDPIADGPTIMRASNTALQNKVDTQTCMAVMQELSARVDIPLLFMTYYNIVVAYGVENFCQRAKACGAQGLIVPDMPRGEEPYEHFYAAAEAAGLPVVSVLAPENAPARISEIVRDNDALLYLPSHSGVTGAKEELADHLGQEVQKIKALTDQPVAVGFGVSQPEHIDLIKTCGADVAVIGSAVIDAHEKSGLTGVHTFLTEMRAACGK